MTGLKICMIVISSIVLIGGLIGCLYSFVIYKQKEKSYAFAILCVSLFIIGMSCFVFPYRVEKYTETVTVQKVGDSFFDYNSLYCETNGDVRQISVGERNRNMFALLEGNDVKLTYGRMINLFGIGGAWHYIDVEVPELNRP